MRDRVGRVLEEAQPHESGGVRVEARLGTPRVARAGDLEAVAVDRVGKGQRPAALPGARVSAGRQRREHEPANALRMRHREARGDARAHRETADDGACGAPR